MANGTIAVSRIDLDSLSGTGIVTINPPTTNTNRTITLPDETGSVLTNVSSLPAANLTGDVAAARITTALNASGTAPIYACRAWVNFNGTGTVAIRASGNVSSITDNGVGNYTVNFTTAMPDANYSVAVTSGGNSSALSAGGRFESVAPTTAAASVFTATSSGTNADSAYVLVNVFR